MAILKDCTVIRTVVLISILCWIGVPRRVGGGDGSSNELFPDENHSGCLVFDAFQDCSCLMYVRQNGVRLGSAAHRPPSENINMHTMNLNSER